MIYRIRGMMRDVRVAIDQNMRSDRLLDEGDEDTLTLDEIVRSKIEEAAQRIVSSAPAHLLDGGKPLGDAVFWGNDGSGRIMLPDDFMRLVVLRMSDWERPVHELLQETDPRYAMQFSRYRGIRGNPQKPVAAIVTRAEGRALEFFACRDRTAHVAQGLYMAWPRVDRSGGIEIPERCYRATVYMAAGLTLASVGEREQAELMTELSRQLLG